VSERVYVDYGPHFIPDTSLWELHLQASPGSPRYKFQSAWKDEGSALHGAKELTKTFKDDTTYVMDDASRKVVAVKFIAN
jgi:hypothetical protein